MLGEVPGIGFLECVAQRQMVTRPFDMNEPVTIREAYDVERRV